MARKKEPLTADGKPYKKRSFDQWTLNDLYHEFQIERVAKNALLVRWLDAQNELTPLEQLFLPELQTRLIDQAARWNEAELLANFINPLVNLAHLYSEKLSVFNERSIKAYINDWQVYGVVDCMLATGIDLPDKPYFFIHEYKPQHKSKQPQAQLLSTMVACQKLNDTKQPLLGCYVVGQWWFFVVLDGNEYAESLAFDATKEEIYQILAILKKAKVLVETELLPASL